MLPSKLPTRHGGQGPASEGREGDVAVAVPVAVVAGGGGCQIGGKEGRKGEKEICVLLAYYRTYVV